MAVIDGREVDVGQSSGGKMVERGTGDWNCPFVSGGSPLGGRGWPDRCQAARRLERGEEKLR